MDKIDLRKTLKEYNPQKKTEIRIIPAMRFIMIDGQDARQDNVNFQEAIETLFSVAYKTKFLIKKTRSVDYAVMPLEGLWWADDPNDFINGRKDRWKWTLMIMQPDWVTDDDISFATEEARKKAPNDPLERLRVETFTEGTCAQVMYVGPYSEEHVTIMDIHETIKKEGGTFNGTMQKHHEIYISDFRKTAPDKLKTILRQPFIQ